MNDNNLLKKFIQFAMGNGIVLILGFISSPIITRLIDDPSQMGKFNMFITVANLALVIVLLGIDQSYVKYYYEEDLNSRGKLLRRCIKVPLSISIVIGFLILFFNRSVSMYIVGQESLGVAVFTALHIAGLVINRFALLQIRMKQKAKLYSFLTVLAKMTYLMLVGVFYLRYNNNYMTLVLSIILSNIVVSIVAIVLERKEWFKFDKTAELKVTTKQLIVYGFPLVFTMIITWLFQSIDKIFINHFCGYKEVGLYGSAMTIVGLLNTFQGAFTTFWVPVAYEHYNNSPEDKGFFIKINNIITVVMVFLAIGLIAMKDIVVLLLGPNYREAVFIFPYLVFMPIMYTISETTVMGINFKGKTKKHILIASVAAIFNLVGNLFLVPIYGAKGAAISTGIAYIVFFCMRTYMSNKEYKVDYRLKSFSISIVVVYILATYSSFHKFNMFIFLGSLVSTFIVSVLYKNTINEGLKVMRSIVKGRK